MFEVRKLEKKPKKHIELLGGTGTNRTNQIVFPGFNQHGIEDDTFLTINNDRQLYIKASRSGNIKTMTLDPLTCEWKFDGVSSQLHGIKDGFKIKKVCYHPLLNFLTWTLIGQSRSGDQQQTANQFQETCPDGGRSDNMEVWVWMLDKSFVSEGILPEHKPSCILRKCPLLDLFLCDTGLLLWPRQESRNFFIWSTNSLEVWLLPEGRVVAIKYPDNITFMEVIQLARPHWIQNESLTNWKPVTSLTSQRLCLIDITSGLVLELDRGVGKFKDGTKLELYGNEVVKDIILWLSFVIVFGNEFLRIYHQDTGDHLQTLTLDSENIEDVGFRNYSALNPVFSTTDNLYELMLTSQENWMNDVARKSDLHSQRHQEINELENLEPVINTLTDKTQGGRAFEEVLREKLHHKTVSNSSLGYMIDPMLRLLNKWDQAKKKKVPTATLR